VTQRFFASEYDLFEGNIWANVSLVLPLGPLNALEFLIPVVLLFVRRNTTGTPQAKFRLGIPADRGHNPLARCTNPRVFHSVFPGRIANSWDIFPKLPVVFQCFPVPFGCKTA
jgi:hypothetical protein